MAKWWIIAVTVGLLAGAIVVLVGLAILPKRTMIARITDLDHGWNTAMVDWIYPTNRSRFFHTFLMTARVTNYGESGWATIVGYVEWDQGRREELKRIHLSSGGSSLVLVRFGDVVNADEIPSPGSYRYGFQVLNQEAD